MPQLRDIRIVLFVTLLTLVTVEVFFSANEHWKWIPPFQIRHTRVLNPHTAWAKAQASFLTSAPDSIVQPRLNNLDMFLNRELDYSEHTVPGTKLEFCLSGDVQVKIKSTNEKIYHAHYTCTPEGRRVTPFNPKASKFLFTLGDSYTFGEGVEDDQNYPARLATLLPSHQVYNMGRPGFGVNDHLFYSNQLSPLYFEGVREKEGIVIYTITNALLIRLILGSEGMRVEQGNTLVRPSYEFDKIHDELILRGKLADTNFLKKFLLLIWSKSATLRYFELFWPLKYSDDDYLLFAKVMSGVRSNLMRKYKIQHFYIAIWEHTPFDMVEGLEQALSKEGFEILDFSTIEFRKLTKGIDKIPSDHHPSAETYWLYAQMLAKTLH